MRHYRKKVDGYSVLTDRAYDFYSNSDFIILQQLNGLYNVCLDNCTQAENLTEKELNQWFEDMQEIVESF